MLNILSINCSSASLASLTSAMKNILSLIQIIGPILLIISLISNLTNYMNNPDDKKMPKKIINSFIATILLFFIPLIVNASMNIAGSRFDFTACWNHTTKTSSNETYQSPYEEKSKQSFIYDSTSYENNQK